MSLTRRVLSDLEDQTMKQQCAAMTQWEFLLVLIINRPLVICMHVISTHLHSLSGFGAILQGGESTEVRTDLVSPAYSEISPVNNLGPISLCVHLHYSPGNHSLQMCGTKKFSIST